MIIFFGFILSDLFYISPSIKPKFRISTLIKHKQFKIFLSNINGRDHDMFNDVVSLRGDPTEMNFEYYNICGRKRDTDVKACVYQKKFFLFRRVNEKNGVKFMTDGNRCLKIGERISNDLYKLEIDKCIPNDLNQLFVMTTLYTEKEKKESKRRDDLPIGQRINRTIGEPRYMRF